MDITTVGVDLAKNIITVFVMSMAGKVLEVRDLGRKEFATWLRGLPKGSIIGMEACSSSHHWGRLMRSLELEPRIMAAEFVKPFRKSRSTKNDRNDAEAICTAVRQPNMRLVSVKSIDQQQRLAWHRMREGWKEERTALINRTRGLLAEFGTVISQSSGAFTRALTGLIHDEAQSATLRHLLEQVQLQLQALDERLAQCDRAIAQQARNCEGARRIQELAGIGFITADAVTATVGDARDFKNGRQFSAWNGITPRQSSSGGKTRLGKITRRGDAYLRTLLIQGAKSALQAAFKRTPDKLNRMQKWMVETAARIGYHKALVAIANKNARMIWAILAKGERFDPNAWEHYQIEEAAQGA